MKYETCLLEISKLAGRDLNSIEKKELNDVVDGILKKVQREDNTGSIEKRVLDEINKITDEMKFKALLQKRIAALNAQAYVKNMQHILTNFKGNLAEGFKSVTTESLTNRQGAKNGLINRVSSAQNAAVGAYQARLVKEGVLDFARKGEFTDQIFMAMQELNSKNPDQKLLASLLPESVTVAKINLETQSANKIRINKAGGQIKNLEGRVVKRTHDPDRLSKWAGNKVPVTSSLHREAWVKEMIEQLDLEKSFGDLDPGQIKESLDTTYQSLVNGEHLREVSLTDSGFVGPASIAKRTAQERTLHFKDKKYELEYYKKASKNANLLDDMVQEIRSGAKDAAVMEHVGPNAKNNIDKMYQTLLKEAYKQGDNKQIAELIATKKDFDRLHWPLLSGQLSGKNMLANASAWTRSFNYAVKLGGAGLNALGDLPFTGLAHRYTGDRTNASYFDGITNTLSNMMEHYTPEEKILLGDSLGIQMDVVAGLPGKFDADPNDAGAMGKFLEFATKLNGISWWQDKLRLGGMMAKANEWASHVGKSFNDLSVGMKNYFEQFNIRDSEWDLIRSTELFSDHKDRKYLTPTMIEDIPLEKFDSVPEVKQRLESIQKTKQDLINKHTSQDIKEGTSLAKKAASLEKKKKQAVDDIAHIESTFKSNDDYVKLKIKLAKEKLALSENAADMDAYLSLQKNNDKTASAFDSLVMGADENLVETKIKRNNEYFGMKRQEKGEALGRKQAKHLEEIKKLEKEISTKTVAKEMDAKVKEVLSSLDKHSSLFDENFKAYQERLEGRAKRLKEYEDSIGHLENAAREKAKQELKNKMGTMYSELGAIIATEPGDIDRGFALQGMKAGTYWGEAIRHFGMFKSFAATVARKHFGRELHGYSGERVSTAEAMKRLFTGDNPSGFNAMATFVPTSMVASYMVQSMKDIAKGLKPRNPFADDPTTPENDTMISNVLGAAALQSTGLGVYTDFLFGEMKTRYGHSPLTTFLGPTFSDLESVVQLFQNMKTTDLEKQTDNAAKALSFLMYNIPGKNLFYTKAAFDYLIGYRIQEMVNPGSLLRMEENLEKMKGQEYFSSPSSNIPYGGF